jgi:hypothetical protein
MLHCDHTVNKCWGEEMPYWTMNRGGIEEAGEPEAPVTEQEQSHQQSS